MEVVGGVVEADVGGGVRFRFWLGTVVGGCEVDASLVLGGRPRRTVVRGCSVSED